MLAVYKREMKSFFDGFTGYISTAFFLLFAGIFVTVTNLFVGVSSIETSYSVTVFVYLIAIPILTMKIMSDEKRSGTFLLLRSLPLRTRDYIFGKYLSLVTMIFIPSVIIFSYTLILSLYGKVNILAALVGTLSLFLCGCALASIGLFISSMTDSPVVAALLCFGAMLLIYFMPTISMLLPTSALGALIVLSVAIIAAAFAIYRLSSSDTLALSCGAVGEIILLFIYFISPERLEGSLAKIFSCLAVTERLESFTASAILDLSSIIYFITVSALFVFFTHEVSEKARLG